MGDIVHCRCVLKLNVDRTRDDSLFLCVPPDWKARIIPCRPKGQTRRTNGPEWEYEEKDGRLHLTPSLLCTDTKFHTDFNWNVEYEICPANTSFYDHFYAINPGIEQ